MSSNTDGPTMNCTRKVLALGLAASFAGIGVTLLYAGQGATAPPRADQPSSLQMQDSRGQVRSTASLVVVPVTVKNRSGSLLTDLTQNDFRVFEDGIERPIAQFSAEAFPLSAAILIDDDLKQSTAEKVQKTLETLAEGFSASDEVALWRFDEVPEPVADNFISDNDALLTLLKHIDLSSSFPGVGSAATTAGPVANTSTVQGPIQAPAIATGRPSNKHIDDAIFAAAKQLSERPAEQRKIIFLISDGQNAKDNLHSYAETLKLLLSEDISVYAIVVGEANLGNTILSKYAHSTGGDIFYGGASREALEGLYSSVTEQARNQYTISYSAAPADRSRPYHAIEVRVKRAGLTVLARDGYYLSDEP